MDPMPRLVVPLLSCHGFPARLHVRAIRDSCPASSKFPRGSISARTALCLLACSSLTKRRYSSGTRVKTIHRLLKQSV
ncbi:hypothetical protein RRG08_002937 [Elysia crispata]|uniref:Uncharacterized protein n=1 Tax=Elysia crispata TaxID=231223 RepID=A0AAE1E2I6_9GAST|nr:hypothetical protein RRG08_002937 [Elysia crispata]